MSFLEKILRKAQSEEGEENLLLEEKLLHRSGEMTFRVGRRTDAGKVREQNQDNFLTLESSFQVDDVLFAFGLFIVADGLVGQVEGSLASSIATKVVAGYIMREIYLPLLQAEGSPTFTRPINEALTEAVLEANRSVYGKVPGAGTTLTGAMVLGDTAYIAHVGDSRAYLIRKGSIRQITQDHSLVARLVELGQVSPEEALNHPQRNYLYRALGKAGELEVDIYSQPLPAESHLLLCSDGLWGMVPESEILQIVSSASHPQEACIALVDSANRHGGEDNITVILVSVT